MRFYFSFLVLFSAIFFSFLTISAQTDPREAKEHFNNRNYIAAVKVYDKLTKEEPTNSEYLHKAGICYIKTNIDKSLAIPYLEKAIKIAKVDPEAFYDLGLAYQYNFRFDDAIKAYEKYKVQVAGKDTELKKADRQIETCYNGKELIKYPVDVNFENLGDHVNTEYPDYYPFIAPDETYLIFTTRRKGSPAVMEFDGFYSSDVYISNTSKGEFEKAKSIGSSVNSSYDEQAVGISGDGNQLFVYVDNIKEFGDIYLAERKPTGSYKKPLKMGEAINSKHLETSGTISYDGNILFFASDKPDGFGGRDIYMTRKLPNGEWALPQNLGPNVNSAYNEDFPNILSDGKTLYFASQGHMGMGGYDIFYSVWNQESNVWSKPKNVGFPINTPEDNHMITFTENGKHGYTSSYRKGGLGDLDIYRVTFNEVETPQTVIKGIISSFDTLQPVVSPLITLFDLKNPDAEPNVYMVNPNNGSCTIIVPPGKYELLIEADGFDDYSEKIFVFDKDGWQAEIDKYIIMKPVGYKFE